MNMYLLDEYVGYFIAYVIMYAVIVGIWNMVFLKWTGKMIDSVLEQEDGVSIAIEYSNRVQNSWMCALCKELYLKPLGDVFAILLWPVYLPAAMITAIYLAKKYLKVPENVQEEPA